MVVCGEFCRLVQIYVEETLDGLLHNTILWMYSCCLAGAFIVSGKGVRGGIGPFTGSFTDAGILNEG